MTDLRDDTPESLAWQEERSATTVTHLTALPGFGPLLQGALSHGSAAKRWPVRRRGTQWFQLRLDDPTAELPVVTVRPSLAAAPRVLLDPNEIAAKRGVPVDLAWAEPSPDGATLAFAVTQVGSEVAEVGLIDVETGAPLHDLVPWSVNFPVSWLPDGSGFWCSGREVVDGVFTMPLYLYRLGEP